VNVRQKDPIVARIFVHAAIKKTMCREAGSDRGELLHSGNNPANSCSAVKFFRLEALPKQGNVITLRCMVPLRTKWRWSTWLALAAMALQIALSFGHIHLESLGTGSIVASVATSKAPSFQQNPAQHPANEADDYCAICATIHLTSWSFLPDTPLLPVPFASRTVKHFGHFAFIFVFPQRAAFQSRAPPLA
jgi:hypothetical protein